MQAPLSARFPGPVLDAKVSGGLPAGVTVRTHEENALGCIAFPEIAEPLAKRVRFRQFSLLLRLPTGSVWFLRNPLRPWTPDLAGEAARYLAEEGRAGTAAETIEDRLAFHLGLPSITVGDPALPHVSDADWDVRHVAQALAVAEAAAEGASCSPSDLRILASAYDAVLRDRLGEALSNFVASLAPEPLAHAQSNGCLDTRLYNYLAEGHRSTWRVQAAKALPILLHAIVTGHPRGDASHIRRAVDEGKPLVKELAAHWEVGPSAIKALVGRSPELVGARWQDSPRQLAQALDALRPEDRPADLRDDWVRLGQAVDTIGRVLGYPDPTDPLFRRLIRDLGRRRFRDLTRLEVLGGDPAGAAVAIAMLRRKLIDSLATTGTMTAGLDLAKAHSRAVHEANHLIADMRLESLVAAGRRLGQELASLPVHRETDYRASLPAEYWPLMRGDFVVPGLRRRVTALTNRAMVSAIGRKMQLCIDEGPELDRTDRACRELAAFMLLISDGVSGQPLSVAEITAYPSYRRASLDMTVLQHKGRANSRAPAGCGPALRELLDHVSTPAGRRHLEEGMERLRCLRRIPREAARLAEHEDIVAILRRSLGDHRYDAAVGRVLSSPELGNKDRQSSPSP